MDNDNRIVELLAELVHKVDVLGDNQGETNIRLDRMDQRLERLEKQQMRTNVLLQEHSLSIMKLGDKLDEQKEVSQRLLRLEDAVFH